MILRTLLIIAGTLTVFWTFVAIVFRSEMQAAFERDPAATSFLEVLLTYAGLHAIVFYRIAHFFYKAGVPFLPRFISQTTRLFTGIEIHPGAVVGKGFFIDHGMGVVIGETSVIGENVTIFQGVTLGGTGKARGRRHPTLGNNVVVGTGAKILGDITVGDNVNIGANAVVIRDIPSNATVVGVPGRVAKQKGKRFPGINLDHTSLPDPLTQALDHLQNEIDHIESEMKEWHEQEEEKKKKKK